MKILPKRQSEISHKKILKTPESVGGGIKINE